MQVDIKIDEKQVKPRAIIVTDKVSEEVRLAVKLLSQGQPSLLMGFNNGLAQILDEAETLRVFSSGQKIFVVTKQGKFLVKMRLYELEERLDSAKFIRISHSEIVSLKMVKHFDLSLSGTICVALLDGTELYASRRYVSKLKQVLGV